MPPFQNIQAANSVTLNWRQKVSSKRHLQSVILHGVKQQKTIISEMSYFSASKF